VVTSAYRALIAILLFVFFAHADTEKLLLPDGKVQIFKKIESSRPMLRSITKADHNLTSVYIDQKNGERVATRGEIVLYMQKEPDWQDLQARFPVLFEREVAKGIYLVKNLSQKSDIVLCNEINKYIKNGKAVPNWIRSRRIQTLKR